MADVLGANGIPVFIPNRDTPTPVVAYTIKARGLAGAVMLSASHNAIGDLAPLSGLRAPSFLQLSHNRVRDLSPLHRWMMADLEKTRNFAPFVRIYLDGNPLSKQSKAQLEELKAKGARINPPAR